MIATKIVGRDATGIRWIEDWDSAKAPTVHRAVPSIKEPSDSNVSKATAEKSSLQNSLINGMSFSSIV